MYEEHPVFNSPPNDAVMWRYMDFTKFVSLLEKQALFFARADQLGDLFEGSLSKVNKDLLPLFMQRAYGEKKIPEGTLESALEQRAVGRKRGRRFTLINCWHQNTHESAAMWRLYSREEDGIAIKTDFNAFKNSFTCSETIYIGRVSYVDYKSDFIPERYNSSRYLHKRKSFEHEREVRAITSVYSIQDKDLFMQFYNDHIGGTYYVVDLSILIQEVVVAPFAPDWFMELVKSITARYNFNFPVVKSTQADDPTWG